MELFGYTFGIIDLIAIGLVLIFALSGLVKGFIKQMLSVANGLVSFIVSCCLVAPVAEGLANTAINDKISAKILETIVTKYPDSASVPMSAISSKEELATAFETSGLSKILSKVGAQLIDINTLNGEMLSDAIAKSLSYLVLTAVVFVVLFIVILVLIKILINVLDSLAEGGLLKFVNKFLGLALGLAKGCIFVCAAIFVVSILAKYVEPINEFLISDLRLGQEGFGIGKYIYESNPIVMLWNIISSKIK